MSQSVIQTCIALPVRGGRCRNVSHCHDAVVYSSQPTYCLSDISSVMNSSPGGELKSLKGYDLVLKLLKCIAKQFSRLAFPCKPNISSVLCATSALHRALP